MLIITSPKFRQRLTNGIVALISDNKARDEMVYCRHCGDQIPVDSIFCPSCGQNLLPEQPNTRPEPAPETSPVSESRNGPRWMQKMKMSSTQRYLQMKTSVIRLGHMRPRSLRVTVSQVLLTGSAAFSLVGFIWNLFGHQTGLSWIGFGIVLGLGALYTKEPPNNGSPPTVQG